MPRTRAPRTYRPFRVTVVGFEPEQRVILGTVLSELILNKLGMFVRGITLRVSDSQHRPEQRLIGIGGMKPEHFEELSRDYRSELCDALGLTEDELRIELVA